MNCSHHQARDGGGAVQGQTEVHVPVPNHGPLTEVMAACHGAAVRRARVAAAQSRSQPQVRGQCGRGGLLTCQPLGHGIVTTRTPGSRANGDGGGCDLAEPLGFVDIDGDGTPRRGHGPLGPCGSRHATACHDLLGNSRPRRRASARASESRTASHHLPTRIRSRVGWIQHVGLTTHQIPGGIARVTPGHSRPVRSAMARLHGESYATDSEGFPWRGIRSLPP